MIDYWVTTGVIAPSRSYRAPAERRDFFLFSFEDLIRIRIVRSLRQAGVSLQRVRVALESLKRRTGPAWQAEWLVTDGRDVYVMPREGALEALTRKNSGQLAFAVIAMGQTRRSVTEKLETIAATPFDERRLKGRIHRLAG